MQSRPSTPTTTKTSTSLATSATTACCLRGEQSEEMHVWWQHVQSCGRGRVGGNYRLYPVCTRENVCVSLDSWSNDCIKTLVLHVLYVEVCVSMHVFVKALLSHAKCNETSQWQRQLWSPVVNDLVKHTQAEGGREGGKEHIQLGSELELDLQCVLQGALIRVSLLFVIGQVALLACD